MKIKELIEKLSSLDPDLTVVTLYPGNRDAPPIYGYLKNLEENIGYYFKGDEDKEYCYDDITGLCGYEINGTIYSDCEKKVVVLKF